MYRHYKGGIYSCHGLATHTETKEVCVVYRHVSGSLHLRPLSGPGGWLTPPDTGDVVVERFTLLPPDFKLPTDIKP